jgi:hypothetical protein
VAIKLNLNEQIQLTVTDILGQKVYDTSPVINCKQILTLDLSKEPKGIYFIQLKTKEGSLVKKLFLD